MTTNIIVCSFPDFLNASHAFVRKPILSPTRKSTPASRLSKSKMQSLVPVALFLLSITSLAASAPSPELLVVEYLGAKGPSFCSALTQDHVYACSSDTQYIVSPMPFHSQCLPLASSRPDTDSLVQLQCLPNDPEGDFTWHINTDCSLNNNACGQFPNGALSCFPVLSGMCPCD